MVLLDNADTMLGRRFLDHLVRARRQRAAGEQDDADPLTVVATSRGALLADVPDTDQALVELGDARSRQPTGVPAWSRFWWLRYRLPDLTEDEVGRAVADLALSWGDDQRLTRVAYQLTGATRHRPGRYWMPSPPPLLGSGSNPKRSSARSIRT